MSTPSLFWESPTSAKQITIKIDGCSCTLDLEEVKDKLLVVDKLALKDPQKVLTVKGTILVRIQYIEDVSVWKKDMQQKLRLKSRQVSKMMDCLQSVGTSQDPDLVVKLMGYLEGDNN